MSFTGPDRADAEGAARAGLGVPKRTKVLVAVALLGAMFWAGWWARGRFGRDECGAVTRAAGGETRPATVPSDSVAVVPEVPAVSDAGSNVAPVPDAAASTATSLAPALQAAADVSSPSAPTSGVAGVGGGAADASGPTPTEPRRMIPLPAVLDGAGSAPPAMEERMTWSVDREGIQGAVREALPDIRECYEAWLRSNPALAGKVTVRFTVDVDPADSDRGKVTKAALVASDVGHPLMEGCVLNVMSGLSFEAPSDGKALDVNYPFVLETAP